MPKEGIMSDRHIRVRWIGRAVLAAIVAVAVLAPFAAGWAHAQNITYRCETTTIYENRTRRVFGTSIATECSGIHTVPFGNWGVDSNGGTTRNGFQFPGWKKQCFRIPVLRIPLPIFCNLLQWNSCTRDHSPTTYPQYYTGNGYTQVPRPDGTAVHASDTSQGYDGTTCRSKGTVASFRGNYMTLREIDLAPGSGRSNDEVVTELNYPDINVPLTCSTDWDCRGSSAWVSPSGSPSVASADIRIRVSTSRARICINPENGCF